MANFPNYFYDGQIRRVILHFTRIFIGIKVREMNGNGGYDYRSIPVTWGDGQGQVYNLINQGMENVAQTVPRMSTYITALERNAGMNRWHGLVDDVLVTEKYFNEETQQYENKVGKKYHIERMVPVPLFVDFSVDIWTSNMDQKLQILEQLLLIFNPDLQIQKSENPLDWTALSRVEMTNISFDNTGVPKGSDEEPNVMTLSFRVECLISPPVKVNKQVLIENIIENIYLSEIDDCGTTVPDIRRIFTCGDHGVYVDGNIVTLLGKTNDEVDENGNIYSWPQLIDCRGMLQSGFSKLRLKWHKDLDCDDRDVIGLIEYDPDIDNILYFHLDPETLPSPTMADFSLVIDPHHVVPSVDFPLVSGTRLLITSDIGENSEVWGMLNASTNDIIEYDGSVWTVAFDASTSTGLEVVVNSTTGTYLRFAEGEWQPIFEGLYTAGYWRLQL